MKDICKVTVIIPAYNVEHYIEKTIESALNQSFDDYEVIVVDDGSLDQTGVICDKYAIENKKFRVIHQENAGVMAARLKGVENSRGEWVTFVDGDDRLPEDSLKTLYAHATDDIDIVWGVRAFVNEKGQLLYLENIKFKGKIDNLKYQNIISRYPKSLHGLLYRRSLFDKKIIIDRQVVNNEDQLYNLFLAPAVQCVYGVNKVVHHYLVRQDSVSKQKYKNDYWYFLFNYIEKNYRKYEVEKKYYETYVLNRICSLIRVEGNHDFDYCNPSMLALQKIKYSIKRSIRENLTIFLLRHHNTFLIKLSRIHPSRLLHK